MILTPLILYIFQVKYKTICLKDRVGIINFRFSDTLSSINDILKIIIFYSKVTYLILHQILMY